MAQGSSATIRDRLRGALPAAMRARDRVAERRRREANILSAYLPR